MRNSIKLLIAVLLMFAMLTLASCGTTPDVTTNTTVDNGGDVVVEDNASIELVDGEVFAYNNEGERVNYNNDFVTINGDVYYAVNNIIVYNQVIINESVYDFGNDGKMVTGTKGDYTYGKDGKLVGGEGVFVTINGDVYCVINNVIVYNQVIVNGAVYNFGDDGKMITGEYGSYKYGEDGKLIANEMFVVINGDIYFVVNNAVVYNRVIIDGFVYDFGDDGKMVTGQKGDHKYGKDGKLVADEIFIEINGDVYFVVNNVIIYNQIIINNDSFYCFDEEGKMVTGEKDGKTYGEDGKLLGNELFVEINGDVYFLINNVIVYNQFIFNGNIYDFGDDGKMVTGEKDGYTYDEEGKLVGNEIFVTINGDVYFIINNVVIYNQVIINGDSFYRFDEEGKMVTGQYGDYTYGEDGKLVGNEIFVTINGNVYFIINNVIVYNQIVINGAVYDFGDDGKMVRDTVKNGYTYGGDGKLVADKIIITINGDLWIIVNNVAYGAYEDYDNDGLSNGRELDYNTDPFNPDSDGDGAMDGKEVDMNFDPTEFNGSFNVTFVPVIDNEDKEDTVTPTIEIELKGDQMNSITVERNDFFNEDTLGYLGDAYKYSVDAEINGATIGFEIQLDKLAPDALPTIYKYDEKTNQMVPLDTTIDGNKATAEVDELSTFVILDRRVYEQELEWVDIWGLDGKTYTDIEIVFVIDDSGSMSSYDSSFYRLTVANNLIDAMPEGSKIGVVRFANNTSNLTGNTLTSDKSVAHSYLTRNYFYSSGGTYMYEAIQSSINLYSTPAEEDTTLRVMVILSDGQPSNTGKLSATQTALANAGIAAYTVGFGANSSYFTQYLEPLSNATGGKFYYSSNASGLAGIFDDIGEKIDLTTDTDGDGLLDYYEDNMVIFNGTKYEPDKTKADTDGDGLLDGEEIQTVIIISVDGDKMSVIGKVHSDPTLKDTDGDGVEDKFDSKPLDATVQ